MWRHGGWQLPRATPSQDASHDAAGMTLEASSIAAAASAAAILLPYLLLSFYQISL